MNELEDIYKRIEYLRNNGVKMKEIADWIHMAPSVLSALCGGSLQLQWHVPELQPFFIDRQPQGRTLSDLCIRKQ